MIQDQLKKTSKNPPKGGDADSISGGFGLAERIPKIDQIMAEIDKSIVRAEKIKKELRRPEYRSCGC